MYEYYRQLQLKTESIWDYRYLLLKHHTRLNESRSIEAIEGHTGHFSDSQICERVSDEQRRTNKRMFDITWKRRVSSFPNYAYYYGTVHWKGGPDFDFLGKTFYFFSWALCSWPYATVNFLISDKTAFNYRFFMI